MNFPPNFNHFKEIAKRCESFTGVGLFIDMLSPIQEIAEDGLKVDALVDEYMNDLVEHLDKILEYVSDQYDLDPDNDVLKHILLLHKMYLFDLEDTYNLDDKNQMNIDDI